MDKRKLLEDLANLSAKIVDENKDRIKENEDIIVICYNDIGYTMSSIKQDREKRDSVLHMIAEHRLSGGDPDLSGFVLEGGKLEYSRKNKVKCPVCGGENGHMHNCSLNK